MCYLNGRQRRRLLDTLAPDLPLKVTSHVIGEDPYWRRCCNQRWAVVDLSRHGGLWKRAFFERMLEETLETFVPGYTYAPRLEECVSYAAPYVHQLQIRQLLPPMKPQPSDKASVCQPLRYFSYLLDFSNIKRLEETKLHRLNN